MVGRSTEIVIRLKSFEDAAALLIAFLQNVGVVQELEADKQDNLQRLNDKYQIVPAQMEALLPIWKISSNSSKLCSLSLHPSRPWTTDERVMKSAVFSLPGSIAGIFRSQYFERSSKTANDLSGFIPSNIDIISKLEFLSLSSDKLIGKIIMTIVNIISLGRFAANQNQFTGPVPFGVTEYLSSLNLTDNHSSEPLSRRPFISTTISACRFVL
ncbi:hypothetical protein KIW84_041576 [Lathyrus oleraceus]|uniref:Eukaryotic translation initiation factor 3 subunit E N-terminal domain-containing protein n=1 Tax=Pisum sativum TaxID=3888 RepID=A0A9D4XA84_PEA|nr:hypothetical protein KIW84_041576 [Pisum sativum]